MSEIGQKQKKYYKQTSEVEQKQKKILQTLEETAWWT